MSDEQQVPVWHSIVGDGWEPVMIGQETRPDDEALRAGGWVDACDGGGRTYGPDMRPRRRRKRRYDVLSMSGGVYYGRVMGAEPGDYFMLAEGGEMIPVDKPPTQSAE